jgi:beta-phosphoglucomutase
MIKPEFTFFDLDGVLIDSEKLKAQAHAYATWSVTGIERDPRDYDTVMGRSQSYVTRYFLNDITAANSTMNRYDHIFSHEYRRLLDTSLHEMPGASAILQALVESKIGIGVVTSSPRNLAERCLSALDLKRYINFMVCSEDVMHHKPSPEPYRLAVTKSGSKASCSIAIDDTDSGIRSARQAGLIAIGLRSGHNAAQKLVDANYFIESLPGLTHLWKNINGRPHSD